MVASSNLGGAAAPARTSNADLRCHPAATGQDLDHVLVNLAAAHGNSARCPFLLAAQHRRWLIHLPAPVHRMRAAHGRHRDADVSALLAKTDPQ
jgi:hypothetical protein